MAENVVINFESNTQPIKDANKELDKLSKEGGAGISKLKDSFGALGAGIAAALSVQAIVSFAKECISKFAEAELQTNQLRFAIEKVGKMGEKVFKDLVKQSKELAAVSFYDDEDIQTAQKVFVQLGLNSKEIKKLIPLVMDLASAQGTTLAEATQKTVGAINGMTRGLRDVGANFKDTGTKVGNLDMVFKTFTSQLDGATAAALDTTSGQLRKMEVDAENLQEEIGEKLAPAFVKLKKTLFEFVNDGLLVNPFDGVFGSGDDAKERFEKYKGYITGSVEAQKRGSAEIREIVAKMQKQQGEFWKVTPEQRTQLIGQISGYNEILRARESADKNANSIAGKDAEDKAEKDKERRAKDAEQAIKDATKLREELQKIFNDPITPIDKTGKPSGDIKTTMGFSLPPDEFERVKKLAEEQAKAIQDIEFQIAEETAAGLFDIFSANINNQIDLVSKQKDEEQKAIDDKLQANQDALDKEQITRRDFSATEKRLLDQKSANELAAQKKINDLKHKADINERIQKLFNIAIATAQGVINYGNNPLTASLIPFVLALGATQAAFVAAQPLPKYHKGRLASFSSEREEPAIVLNTETITNPKASKDYHPTLTAIHKGTIPANAMNNFVRNFRMSDFSGGRSMSSFDYYKNASEIEWQLRGQNKLLQKELRAIRQAIQDGNNNASDLRRA